MKRDALTSFQLVKMKKLDSDYWRSGGIGRDANGGGEIIEYKGKISNNRR